MPRLHHMGITVGDLDEAVARGRLSARGVDKVIRLAWTIADLAGSQRIETVHLAEAIQYRPRRTE